MQRNSKRPFGFGMQIKHDYINTNVCVPTDGARVSLTLHVSAASQGEGRNCEGAWITYRYHRTFILSRTIYIGH